MCEPAATVEEEQQQVPPEELVPPEEIPPAEEKLVPAEKLEAPARELVTKSEKELQALEGQQQAPVQEGQQTAGKVYKNFKSAKYPCEWDLNGDGVNDAKDDPKLFWDGKIPVKYDEKVVALQTYLTDLGFDRELEPEGIDGKFGPHTKNAVMAYQQDRGLIVDGIVGPNTWRLLCDDIYFLLKED